MCFFLYLASANNLETKDWEIENPQVVIDSKSDISFDKTEKFKKENIFVISSTEGCGCGFRQEFDVKYPDCVEAVQKIEKDKNQQQLCELLTKVLKNEDYVELFSCWADDEESEIEFQREIILDELLEETFYFREKELIKVAK